MYKVGLILWQGRSVGLGKHLEFPGEGDLYEKQPAGLPLKGNKCLTTETLNIAG